VGEESSFRQGADGGLARRLRAARIPGEGQPRSTLYAVASGRNSKAIDVFVRREDAEAMIEKVRLDEPELADMLRVETIEFGDWAGDSY
jgi:hypothetical protein